MKTLVRTMLVLLLAVTSVTFSAQQDVKYVVQPGDNLWNLAGEKLGNSQVWAQLVEQNPFLKQPGRSFERDGKKYVIIRPGEQLAGLEELGVTSEDISYAWHAPEPITVAATSVEHDTSWLWAVLAVVVLLLLVAYLILRMLNADPATTRTPVVNGGVNEVTARNRFQEMAAERYTATTGTSHPIQRFTILEQTAGHGYGIIGVVDGTGKVVPRKLQGEPVFRARVRFPDEHQEDLYMLQRCGNDLRFGGVSHYIPGKGFRFEPDSVIAANPAPAAPAVPVEPAPVAAAPSVAETAQQPAAQDDGKVQLEYRPETDGQPNMVRLSGVEVSDFSFSSGPEGVTFRFREIKKGRRK